MRLAEDVVLLLGFGLAAVDGADWLVVITLVIGSAGISGLATAWLGLAKYRSEQKQQRIVGAVQVRTVAAEEAEAAMRIMGQTVDRVNAENERITLMYEALRADLDACLREQRRSRGGP
jgi:Tfp pilus assembly protein PilX